MLICKKHLIGFLDLQITQLTNDSLLYLLTITYTHTHTHTHTHTYENKKGRNKTTMSVKWRQSTGETRIRHVNPLTPISPRLSNTIPETTQLALKECVKMNNNNGINNDMTKTTSLLATSNVSPTDKTITFNYLKAQNGNAVVTSVNNHHNLNLNNNIININNNNNNNNNNNSINNSVGSNNVGGLSEYYSCS